MPVPATLRLRRAGPDDAQAVARLHADSWRRHYRGAFSDAFLDDDVADHLLSRWTERLTAPDGRARTTLAVIDDVVVGLAHTVLDEHPVWGACLDNLHVSYHVKGRGIGTRLLSSAAQDVLDRAPSSGLYLWVLEQNHDARAFYTARGGTCVERAETSPPGGDPTRLAGKPMELRITWPDPATLPAAS